MIGFATATTRRASMLLACLALSTGTLSVSALSISALSISTLPTSAMAAALSSDSQANDKGDTKLVLFTQGEQGAVPLGVEEERYLAFGQAMFDFYGDHRFRALSQLTSNKKQGLFDESTDYANLLMGELYVAYGLPGPAEQIFNALLQKDIVTRTRAETWLHKAELHFQSNQLEQAQHILESSRVNGLSPEMEIQKNLVLANVLIALNQFAKAQRVLEVVPESSPKRIFADYNIAVALIRNNNIADGQKLLDQINKQKTTNEEQKTVKDRAALTAGLVALKQQQFNSAISALSQINTNSPFSNDAILVMGLAYYEAGKTERALPLWLALVNRNSADPSVQEAILQTPKAYEDLGAFPQALEGYQFATLTYRDELRKVENAITNLEQNQWLESLLPSDEHIRQNPDPMSTVSATQTEAGPETLYLYRLFSSRDFAKKFREYQQIQRLGMLLERWYDELGTLGNTFIMQKQQLQRVLPTARARLATVLKEQQKLDELVMMFQLPHMLDMSRPATLADYPQSIMLDSVKRLETSGYAGSERLRRVKGLLLWDIASAAPDNRARQESNLSKLNSDNQTLTVRIEAVKQLVSDANQHVNSNLDQRFASKRSQLKKLITEAHDTLDNLQKMMESEALVELAKIRIELSQKLAQANLGEARLQDQSVIQRSSQ